VRRAKKTVDVRILSATHRHLADLVAQGLFREDLFYRINVIELHVPALRERRGDIAEIAEAILLRLARRTNAAPTRAVRGGGADPSDIPLPRQRARARKCPGTGADLEQ